MPRGERSPRGGFRERGGGGFERREGGREGFQGGFERRAPPEPRMGARRRGSSLCSGLSGTAAVAEQDVLP